MTENEMASHQERKNDQIMAYMRLLGDLQEQAERTRAQAIKNEANISRLTAFNDAINQLDVMRQQMDAKAREIKQDKAALKVKASWVKPIENGFGYPHQFPKQPWDGFQAVLDYLPAEQRKAIHSLAITGDERTADNLVNATGLPCVDMPDEVTTLGNMTAYLIRRGDYPRQMSPLHNVFNDDVFPKIKAALAAAEVQFAKDLDAAVADKMKTVQELLKAGETSA